MTVTLIVLAALCALALVLAFRHSKRHPGGKSGAEIARTRRQNRLDVLTRIERNDPGPKH